MQSGQAIIARLPAWLEAQKGVKGEFEAVIGRVTERAFLLETLNFGDFWAPKSQLQIIRTIDKNAVDKVTARYDLMKRTPWQHQQNAFNFTSTKAGALDASDMGTGKTFNVVAEWVSEQPPLTLIVAPATAVRVWPNEFAKLCSSVFHMLVLATDGPKTPKTRKLENGSTITTCGGSVEHRARMADDFMAVMGEAHQPAILVINYEAAWREPFGPAHDKDNKVIPSRPGVLGSANFDLVVLDEGHRIKSVRGTTARFFVWLGKRTKKRRVLTGTPSANGPLDVYMLVKFCDPTIFPGTFSEFRSRYAILDRFKNPIDYINMGEYAEKLASVMYRVMAKDVLELPGANHTFRTFALTEKSRRTYDAAEGHLVKLEEEDPHISPENILVELVRLQQITSGYAIDNDEEYHRLDEGNGKDKALADVLDDLDPHKPVIVFAKFTGELDIIRSVALKAGRPYREISGRVMNGKKKDGLAEDGTLYIDPSDTMGVVCGVQIDSGGAGVNLIEATTAIYWSTGYNLVSYDQSLKRNHRPGQTQPVTYIHLVAENTVDEAVIEALEKKTNIIKWSLAQVKARQKELAG